MEATDGGGQNTPAQTSPAVTSLETDLQNVAAAVAALFADARAVDPERDEFGHARSRAYTDAVALLKVSAKLGHSIAAMRGSKFEHNINVRRQEIATSGPFDADGEEDTSIWLNDETLWDWKNKRTYVLDRSRGPDGRPAHGISENGTPLPISGGSNGNFGNSEPPVSQISE